MGNQLIYEDVKRYVEIESNSGCILLNKTYNKAKDKLLFLCKCGEKFEASFDNFKSNNKRMCNKCSEKIRVKKRSLSYEEVKKYIESNSKCKLMDDEYKNNSTPLNIRCGCGNVFKANFAQFKNQNKRQCNTCGSEKRITNKNRALPRKTINEIKSFIEKNSKCTLLSDTYKNNSTKLKIKCNCGEIFNVSYSNFKKGKRQCNKCTINSNRSSIEEIKNYIETNSKCKLLDYEYVNNGHMLKLRCVCGNIFNTTLTSFKYSNKKQCNDCGINNLKEQRKFSYNEVKLYIENNSKCKLLSKNYENYKSKIKLLCECGNEFITTFASFKTRNKRQCNNCGNILRKKHQTKTHDQFSKEVYEQVGYEYSIKSEYKGNKNKIKLKHNICGHEYLVQPSSFLSGVRCPKCNGGISKTHKEFVEEVNRISNNEYIVVDEYKNSMTPIKMLHKNCGHIWLVYPSNFTSGSRCPKCNQSKGEKTIEKYLKRNDYIENIDYIPQKEFFGLLGLGGKNLSYDFYIPKCNLLIEYQGEFHDGTAHQQSKEDFMKQQEHDKRKKEYAELHNIELLEIWYWDFDNIESILEYKLNKILSNKAI